MTPEKLKQDIINLISELSESKNQGDTISDIKNVRLGEGNSDISETYMIVDEFIDELEDTDDPWGDHWYHPVGEEKIIHDRLKEYYYMINGEANQCK